MTVLTVCVSVACKFRVQVSYTRIRKTKIFQQQISIFQEGVTHCFDCVRSKLANAAFSLKKGVMWRKNNVSASYAIHKIIFFGLKVSSQHDGAKQGEQFSNIKH